MRHFLFYMSKITAYRVVCNVHRSNLTKTQGNQKYEIFYLKVGSHFYLCFSHITYRQDAYLSYNPHRGTSRGDAQQAVMLRPLLSDLFDITDVTVAVADRAGEQIKKYAQEGRQLSQTDTLIAATAFEYGYCLVTRNVRDFLMPELEAKPSSF